MGFCAGAIKFWRHAATLGMCMASHLPIRKYGVKSTFLTAEDNISGKAGIGLCSNAIGPTAICTNIGAAAFGRRRCRDASRCHSQ
mmetsp:Transcript_95167/g.159794  ORF Transcript_95167/g.159794 Transcript_95167/m.159794 type:complete len:85 (-) Transcript_95167:1233-1487(-)